MKYWSLLLVAATLATAQIPGDNFVLRWNNAALQAVRNTRMGPPMTARALAILHTAIYDAWCVYDASAAPVHFSQATRRPASEWTTENRIAAASYAAYDVLVDLFPGQTALFRSVMSGRGYDPAESAAAGSPAAIGRVAARAVLEMRHADGSNQLNGYADTTGYQTVNTPNELKDPNRWQPLAVPDGKGGFTTQRYLAPHWGLVKPFGIGSGDRFRPDVKLPVYGTRDYEEQARALVAYSGFLTEHQKIVAEYWADGPASETPPGHWCLLAQDVSRRDQHTFDQDVKMFFVLTNALMDASIAAWDAKRIYEYVRPISAIRYIYKGKMVAIWGGPNHGTERHDGGEWQPYQALTFVTPPFPEYVSGHSTFSAAGAEILKRFTGSDVFGKSVTFQPGTSFIEPGTVPASPVVLSWSTFSEAADEAGISRRYGGIHFVPADLDGRALGRKVGAAVWQRAMTLFSGGVASPTTN